MGFFLRKGFNLGPLRLNLSKSGIGASIGVKGARVGINAKGKGYVSAGRGGIYYRKTLGSVSAPASSIPPPPEIKSVPDSVLDRGILDRIIDVTEHHDHAVEEKPIEGWNSRIYDRDLTGYKNRLETQQWEQGIHLKGSTPTMSVFADRTNQFETRMLFETAGESGTRLTITFFNAQGSEITEEYKDTILSVLKNIDTELGRAPQAQRPRRRVLPRFIAAVLAGGVLLWLSLLAVNLATGSGGANSSTAAVATPTPTVTPTPSLQRKTRRLGARARQP
jgi:hypothetical protein